MVMIEAPAVPGSEYVKGQLYQIPLELLQPDPGQPRKYVDAQALDELASSIVSQGVLTPILFRRDAQGGFIVVAGERRVEAARKAGLEVVPALLVEGNPAEIALVENLLRQNLTPVEEAEALERIMTEQDYRQEDLSRIIGRAQPHISEALSLNRLPQAIRDECRSDPSVPRYILVEIAKGKQERGMLTRYQAYRAKLQSQQEVQDNTQTRRRTKAEAILASATSLQTRMAALKPEECEAAVRQNLAATLQELKQTIDTLLTALQAGTSVSAAKKKTTGTKKVMKPR